MNKRAVILDFTSLLDVIMIILFFFILFSHFETEEARLAMQSAEQSALTREKEAEELIDKADGLLSEAEEKNRLADERFKEAEAAEERSGANAAAISEFSGNRNIKIKLRITSGGDDWSIDVFKGEEKLAEIPKSDINSMVGTFLGVLSEAGCGKDDTLLCMFVYNAMEKGTNSACRSVDEILGEVKKQYRHFYYSEVDTSLFGEE